MAFHDRSFHQSIEDFRPWAARETRYEVAAATTVTMPNGTSAAAVVVNISNCGCRISSEAPISEGERLSLVVEPLGMVDAEVRWTRDTDAGLKLVGRDPFYSDYRSSYLP